MPENQSNDRYLRIKDFGFFDPMICGIVMTFQNLPLLFQRGLLLILIIAAFEFALLYFELYGGHAFLVYSTFLFLSLAFFYESVRYFIFCFRFGFDNDPFGKPKFLEFSKSEKRCYAFLIVFFIACILFFLLSFVIIQGLVFVFDPENKRLFNSIAGICLGGIYAYAMIRLILVLPNLSLYSQYLDPNDAVKKSVQQTKAKKFKLPFSCMLFGLGLSLFNGALTHLPKYTYDTILESQTKELRYSLKNISEQESNLRDDYWQQHRSYKRLPRESPSDFSKRKHRHFSLWVEKHYQPEKDHLQKESNEIWDKLLYLRKTIQFNVLSSFIIVLSVSNWLIGTLSCLYLTGVARRPEDEEDLSQEPSQNKPSAGKSSSEEGKESIDDLKPDDDSGMISF